ncbi:DUF2909 domain-containing protein [Marinimicrobium sp. ABcell2]|uniref:DUF2909 domain-containing protein n=1 Tax=Marinimicrobium sp. ABcell2 TaxID=3069751 RepID=UPI0027ADF754|nr:DUF2909 domain-containing protein [Marinimicrobium sp. ABcell2]MDQ2076239.1 DUF2909 domain-containing protein [Marinimicrobium sp. ABcell2]
MWLKILIVVLFIGVVLSLGSGLRFLLKDMGVPESKRTLYALGVRVCLATVMMALIFYGFHSGILTSQAPWDAGP